MSPQKVLIANFGGPRHLDEIESFLIALLTDPDVIQTPFPQYLQNLFFTRVAKKRALKIRHDYELIGGKSPIFEDTEFIAKALNALTFHRYLTSTHPTSIPDGVVVFPMFPQFSYSTTGSIAQWFYQNLSTQPLWIKSYASHPAYIQCMVALLQEFLVANNLKEEECYFLFSAHGLPQKFIDQGDPYNLECESSFRCISSFFPKAECGLCFQSKFGRGEWLQPYTDEMCKNLVTDKKVIIIPLSFTSDHIETLFEIEKLYLPMLRERGIQVYRLPALNRRPDWIQAIATIIKDAKQEETPALIR